MIRFTHACGQVVSAPDSAAGRRGTCPKCGGEVVLPSPMRPPRVVTPAVGARAAEAAAPRPAYGSFTLQLQPAEARRCASRAIVAHWIVAGIFLLLGLLTYGRQVSAMESEYHYLRRSVVSVAEPGMQERIVLVGALLLSCGIPFGLNVGIALLLGRFHRTAVALSIGLWLMAAFFLLFIGVFWVVGSMVLSAYYRPDGGILVGLLSLGLAVLSRWLAASVNRPAVWRQAASVLPSP